MLPISPYGAGNICPMTLLVPGLRSVAGLAYDAFARNRTTISFWLGLAACGVPGAPAAAASAPAPAPEPILLRRWWRGRLPMLRELGVAFTLFVMAAELSVANAAIPQALRWTRRPDWMMYLVMYPHIFQSWSMFSPDAPLSDYMVVIDAVTRDGRHVDPLNEIGSRVSALPVADIPPRLGHSSIICDYTLRIPDAGSYHQALIEWVLRYPERTGHKQDEIASFQAFQIEHASPAPGEAGPHDVRRRMFLQWPAPGGT